jgi:autotransporter-associated beta strand protein
MIITGGTFDSRQTADDVLVNGGFTGSLTIDGGQYIKSSGTFVVGFNGGATLGSPTLNINSGSFTVANLQFGQNAGIATGGINGVVNLNGGTLAMNLVSEQSTLTSNGFRNSDQPITSTLNFNGGVLQARQTGTIMNVNAVDNAVVKSGGAFIDTNTFNTTIAKALTAGSPSGGLTKQGAGTLTLSAVNTYTGATTVSTGTLALSAGGTIANSSTILVGSGATLSVAGVTSSFTLGATQTLGGPGTILATGKTVVANGTLSPGSSPGTMTQDGGTLQLGANGDLNWQVLDASGAAGTGYDSVNLINGASLSLSLLSSSTPYNINLWSLSSIGPDMNGNAIGFNNTQDYTWTLFSQTTAISGFDPSLFAINVGSFNGTSGFSNDLGGGSFSVALGGSGNSLVLNYTAIPEPSTAILGGLGLLALLRRRRN